MERWPDSTSSKCCHFNVPLYADLCPPVDSTGSTFTMRSLDRIEQMPKNATAVRGRTGAVYRKKAHEDEIKGHQFVKKYFRQPAYCSLCHELLWWVGVASSPHLIFAQRLSGTLEINFLSRPLHHGHIPLILMVLSAICLCMLSVIDILITRWPLTLDYCKAMICVSCVKSFFSLFCRGFNKKGYQCRG